VLDRAILAGGVHRLEDQEDRPPILRVQLGLQGREALDVPLEKGGSLLLVRVEAARVTRRMVLQPELRALRDAVPAEELLEFGRALSLRPLSRDETSFSSRSSS
jgi:hypothetical protein